MPTKIRISAKKTQQKPLEEGFLDFFKGKKKAEPGGGAQQGDPRQIAVVKKTVEKIDSLAPSEKARKTAQARRLVPPDNLRRRILKQKRAFILAGGEDADWQSFVEALPNYSYWFSERPRRITQVDSVVGVQQAVADKAAADKAAAERAPEKQQKGKKASVKAAELRAEPVKCKILTTKSVVNRLKAAGITDQKVIDQANRVIKKYIEKAVAGQVPVYEAVNLAVGGQSLLKQLMGIPGLRAVPDSVIKQILKDLEVQLTANEIEVIKSKKDLAASGQQPGEEPAVAPEEPEEPESEATPAEDQAKLSDEEVQQLKQAVGPRTGRPWKGTNPELASKIAKSAEKAVEDSVTKLELQEAFNKKSEIIYEKLLKKWNIK